MKSIVRVFASTLLICLTVINAAGICAAENQITLVTQRPLDNPAGKFLDMVYTEAFRRLDMTFVYAQYPARRASLMSDLGEVGGELSRIYSYNDQHPNVIRVEEPHWTSGFLAVSNNASIHLDGWNSLLGTDYTVNFRRGIKGCEENLPKVVIPENLEMVRLPSHGLKRVLNGWADLYIGAEFDLINLLTSDEFKDSGLQIVGVMEIYTGHAFLHKKHEKLVPKLSHVLQDMKREGLFEQYQEAANLTSYITSSVLNYMP